MAWGDGGWGMVPDSGISTATPSVMSGASSLAQGLCHSSRPPSHASYEGYGPGQLPAQFSHLYPHEAGAGEPDPTAAFPELLSMLKEPLEIDVAAGAAKILSSLVKRPNTLRIMVCFQMKVSSPTS